MKWPLLIAGIEQVVAHCAAVLHIGRYPAEAAVCPDEGLTRVLYAVVAVQVVLLSLTELCLRLAAAVYEHLEMCLGRRLCLLELLSSCLLSHLNGSFHHIAGILRLNTAPAFTLNRVIKP